MRELPLDLLGLILLEVRFNSGDLASSDSDIHDAVDVVGRVDDAAAFDQVVVAAHGAMSSVWFDGCWCGYTSVRIEHAGNGSSDVRLSGWRAVHRVTSRRRNRHIELTAYPSNAEQLRHIMLSIPVMLYARKIG